MHDGETGSERLTGSKLVSESRFKSRTPDWFWASTEMRQFLLISQGLRYRKMELFPTPTDKIEQNPESSYFNNE